MFDPNAVDGSGNRLYSFWMPLYDVNYDAAIFVPGTAQRSVGELICVIAGRTMKLAGVVTHTLAYLDVAIGAGTHIILAIEKNRVQIGTIIALLPVPHLDAGGAAPGAFNIPATTDWPRVMFMRCG